MAIPPSAQSNPWLYAGLASSIPDIQPDGAKNKTRLRSASSEDAVLPPPCKILRPPPPQSPQPLGDTPRLTCVELSVDEAQATIGLEPQVLVFRYRNKLHAVDHNCPHRNYPLSRGSLTDIEDFGIVLSTAIVCQGHGWAFDVNTGQCSKGGYRLKVWEAEARPGKEGEEVWVRMKT